MKKFFFILSMLIPILNACASEKAIIVSEKILNNYKVYSLARCISNNYIEMGVSFNKLPLKDYTTGFIDIEEGFAFSVNKGNTLDLFIRNKTGKFYQPKQKSGDLASVNLVIYDCVDFYKSKELQDFLIGLIQKSETNSDTP
ncbi:MULTISPECIES: hypothetical protein [Citrobacter]|uniref:hypothetical protein n=1 Tax=Citrobacter TaxID=544 RepID=UPI001F2D6219|nr:MULTISPECIES: hypothetical protein [Citrobacter]